MRGGEEFNIFCTLHYYLDECPYCSFALGNDDDDKVDLIKLPGIGCMAMNESIHTWR